MIQVTLEDDDLTWDSLIVPTGQGVRQLPEYGGFLATAKGLTAMGKPSFGLYDAAEIAAESPDEWPVDPPFEED